MHIAGNPMHMYAGIYIQIHALKPEKKFILITFQPSWNAVYIFKDLRIDAVSEMNFHSINSLFFCVYSCHKKIKI